jgi:opacity protein-like surface antigen
LTLEGSVINSHKTVKWEGNKAYFIYFVSKLTAFTMNYSKWFLLFTLCSVLHVRSWAQKGSWSLDASIGANIPVGQFASENASNAQAGWANPGANLQIEGIYQCFKYGGIGALVGFQSNPTENQQVKENQSGADPTYYVIHTGNYVQGRTYVGPTLRIPLRPLSKWAFTARLMGGLQKLFPVRYTMASQLDPATTYNAGNSFPVRFGWQIGTGLEYTFHEKFFVLLSADYTQAGVGNTGPNRLGVSYEHPDQPLNTLNINIGIGGRLP